MTASIRQAFDEDAPMLARIGAETFVETFGHLYKPADLNAFLAKSHSVGFYEDLLGDPEYGLWSPKPTTARRSDTLSLARAVCRHPISCRIPANCRAST